MAKKNPLQMSLFDLPVDVAALRQQAADDVARLGRVESEMLRLHEDIGRARALQNDDEVARLIRLERGLANQLSQARQAVQDWKTRGLL